MIRSRNSLLVIGLVIGAIVVASPILLMLPQAQEPTTEIKVTVLMGSGVMVEAKGVRIYIDPLFLPSNYSELPADVILITHSHTDNYCPPDIETVLTNDTLFVCPENMTEAIERFDGFSVNPGDSFLVDDINITAFPMYCPDYTSGVPSNHPRDANWTSYIIDIDGFRLLHNGDAKYMDEYQELTGTIDLALLSINFDPTWGGVNMSLLPVVDSIDVIQPRTVIPINTIDIVRDTFVSEYGILIEFTECEILNIPYFTAVTFETSTNNA